MRAVADGLGLRLINNDFCRGTLLASSETS
jgi:hypothetical protein